MSIRKTRLYCVACCRRIWPLITDERLRAELESIDADPMRNVPMEQRAAIQTAISALQFPELSAGRLKQLGWTPDDAELIEPVFAAHMAAWKSLADEADEGGTFYDLSARTAFREVSDFASDAAAISQGQAAGTARRKERAFQQNLERCIFGVAALDPRWLTSTVADLATAIYEEKAFDRMPILADALMDAGCDSDKIIAHCRDESGVHARGCWVVDLLLGKT